MEDWPRACRPRDPAATAVGHPAGHRAKLRGPSPRATRLKGRQRRRGSRHPVIVMKILGLSGSLRAASLNSAFLRLAAAHAPAGVTLVVDPAPGRLPLFNADLEATPPDEVRRFRLAVSQTDAMVIASPEYAHGISGVMKNALDWLVGDAGFIAKPIALVNTSPRAHHAQEALAETLRTMSARIVGDASISVALLGSGLDPHDLSQATDVRAAVERMFVALALACLPSKSAEPPNVPIA